MCRSSRRSWSGLLLLAAPVFLFAAATLSAQVPATPVASRSPALTEPHDTADLYGSLRDVINYGAELFNKQADHAGCYRVYQGALISMRPFLAPAVRKQIDASIHRAEALPHYSERAFELRRILDDIRAKAAPSKTGPPTVAGTPRNQGSPISFPANDPPRNIKVAAPKIDLPKIVEAPKVETPKVDVPKIETPKIAATVPEVKKVEAPKIDLPKADPLTIELPKVETPKTEPVKIETPKIETPKIELPKSDPLKIETPKIETPKIELPKSDPLKIETPKIEAPKVEAPKIELPKSDPLKIELPKSDPLKIELPKADPLKIETPKVEAPKIEPRPLDLNLEIPAPVAPPKEKKVESAKGELPKLDPFIALPTIDAPKEKKAEDKGKPKGELGGVAMLDGKPLPPGFFVTLVSGEGKRYSTTVQKEGSYRFTLGVPVGTYRVVVEPVSAEAGKQAMVPARYRDESTSGLTIQIVPGRQTHDLRLAK